MKPDNKWSIADKASVAFIVAASLALNMLGAYALYTLLGSLVWGVIIAVFGVAVEVLIVRSYLNNWGGFTTFTAHIVCVGLLVFGLYHVAGGEIAEGEAAAASVADYATQLTDLRKLRDSNQRRLDTLENPTTDKPITQLATDIKRLKNMKAGKVSVWTDSNGCTNGKQSGVCEQIATNQLLLDTEKSRLEGSESTSLRSTIARQNDEIVGITTRQNAESTKTSHNGKAFGTGGVAAVVSLVLSMVLGVGVEVIKRVFLLKAGRRDEGENGCFTPDKRPTNLSGRDARQNDDRRWGVFGMFDAWRDVNLAKAKAESDRAKADVMVERTKAEAAVATVQIAQEIVAVASSTKIDVYLKNIPVTALHKLMAKHGMAYHTKAGAKLLVNLQRALSLYEAGSSASVRSLADQINSAFNLPTATTHGTWKADEIGDVSPYVTRDFCQDSLMPALDKLGLLVTSGTSRRAWVDALTARKVVGGDVAAVVEESVPTTQVTAPVHPVAKGRPQLKVVGV